MKRTILISLFLALSVGLYSQPKIRLSQIENITNAGIKSTGVTANKVLTSNNSTSSVWAFPSWNDLLNKPFIPVSIWDMTNISAMNWAEDKILKFNASGQLVVGTDLVGDGSKWTSGTYGINYTSWNVGIGNYANNSYKLNVESNISSGYAALFSNASTSGNGMRVLSAASTDNGDIASFWGNGLDWVSITAAGTINIRGRASAPLSPGSSYGRLYALTDGKLYWKNSTGTAYDLTLSGGEMTSIVAGLGLQGGGSTGAIPLSTFLSELPNDNTATTSDYIPWMDVGSSDDKKMTLGQLSTILGTGGGTSNHALLSNLDYAGSEHTGFAAINGNQNEPFVGSVVYGADGFIGGSIHIEDDGNIWLESATVNTIAHFDSNKNLKSLPVSTYPNLTELSYVKGVTSGIQTQINSKQNTLVSGTNIKTVNGTSLLGSGNVSITSAVAWGSITGTLSNQTDLQTALNARAMLAGSSSQAFSTANLSVTGTVVASGSITCSEGYRGSSDIRLKEHIKPIKSDYSKINLLQFEMKSDSTDRTNLGAIAQQVEKTHPELVFRDENGMKSIAYIEMLIGMVNDLRNENKKFEIRIKQLENEK